MNILLTWLILFLAVLVLTGCDFKSPHSHETSKMICGTIQELTCPDEEYCDLGVGQCNVADIQKRSGRLVVVMARLIAMHVSQQARAFPSIMQVNASHRNLKPAGELLEFCAQMTRFTLMIWVTTVTRPKGERIAKGYE